MFDLIKKAQMGNDKAFLTLFHQYEQDIYRIAFVYLKNQSDSLDVVQETAYRSFKSIKKLKEPKHFKAWLIRIAINCAIDLLRNQKNIVQLKPEFLEFISDVNEDIDLEMTVQSLIDNLNENEKSVIILRFYEGLTIKEVSEILKIPLGTTKTVLYKALDKLRKDLKGGSIYEQ